MISIFDGWLGGSPGAPFLLDISFKGAVLLLVALLLTAGLRRTSASLRHRVWSLAFVSLLALPLLVAALPAWRVPVLPAGMGDEGSRGRAPASDGPAAPEIADADRARWLEALVEGAGPISPEPPAASSAPERTDGGESVTLGGPVATRTGGATADGATAAASGGIWRVGRVLLGVWALGALCLLGRLVMGTIAAAWTTRRATPLDDPEWRRALQRVSLRLRIRREVRLLASDRVSVPVTWGTWRPSVVLPREAKGWPEERRRVVLLHELAHVKRRDCLVHVVSQAARALHWLNPLAWTGARRLRAERERACDDLVISSGTRAPEYAHHLLEIARATGRGRPGRAAWAAVAMARPTELEGRLLAILDSGRPRRRPGRLASAGAFVAVAVLLFPIAAFQPAPRAAASPSPSTPLADVVSALDPERISDPRTPPELVPASPAQERVVPRLRPERRLERGANRDLTAELRGQLDVGDAPALRIEVDGPAFDVLGLDGLELRLGEPGSSLASGLVRLARDTGLEVGSSEWGFDLASPPADTTELRILRALLTALADEDASMRTQAANALGRAEHPAAVESLSTALRSDENAAVREQTAWALGMIESQEAVPALVDALGDAAVGVRKQAAWALGMIESAEAVPGLVGAADDDDADVRAQVAWALGMIESPEAAPGLERLVSDPEPRVRKQAVWALGMIESPESIPALTTALEDEDAEIRKQAAWALGMVESAEAVPALLRALDDPSPEVRKQAVWALGTIEDPGAADALIDAIEDEDVEVRKQALWALSQVIGG